MYTGFTALAYKKTYPQPCGYPSVLYAIFVENAINVMGLALFAGGGRVWKVRTEHLKDPPKNSIVI